MFDAAEIARRGRHVGLLGLILAGLMGALLWLWPGPLAAIAGAPQTSFRGSVGQAWGIVLGLGAIGLTGVAFAIGGGLMIAGRASRAATVAAIALFVAGVGCLGVALVLAYAG